MGRQAMPVEVLQSLPTGNFSTAAEIKRLWKRFSRADRTVLKLEEALQFPELQSNPFGARIVELCSTEGRGTLDFADFLQLVAIFHPRTPAEAKAAWAFAMWDFDGDDVLGASDLKQGLSLLANGITYVPSQEDREADLFGANPQMFEGSNISSQYQSSRRNSRQDDLLSNQEISQVMHRIATEIEPVGNGISFEEFEMVVMWLPDFASNFTMNF